MVVLGGIGGREGGGGIGLDAFREALLDEDEEERLPPLAMVDGNAVMGVGLGNSDVASTGMRRLSTGFWHARQVSVLTVPSSRPASTSFGFDCIAALSPSPESVISASAQHPLFPWIP